MRLENNHLIDYNHLDKTQLNLYFDEVYKKLLPIRKSHIIKSKRSYGMDEHEAIQVFDDTLFELLKSTNVINKLEHALNRALHRRRINFRRDNTKVNYYETPTEDMSITSTRTDEVECVVLQKEVNHRQVIDSLLRRSPYDADTTAIVNAALRTSEDFSLRDISRQTGIHVETVRRKLRKLSRYYDEAVFGSFHELFAS